MRLIDADALIEEHCKGCSKDIQDGCKTDPVCATLMWFDDAPTIDAVPVVRCGECERRDKGFVSSKGTISCPYMEAFMHEDDFCSYGERKDGDGNG